MINILCFGDSNTHGANPSGGRWDEDNRWPTILAKRLGGEYHIHEAGLCGRTTVFEDWFAPMMKGSDMLLPCLHMCQPVDLIIIMLGTNDIKQQYNTKAIDAARGVEVLINQLRNPLEYNGRILIISPIHIGDNITETFFDRIYGAQAIEVSKQFAPLYKEMADMYGCYYLDASLYAHPSPIDAVHMDAQNHHALADAVYDKVKEIFAQRP